MWYRSGSGFGGGGEGACCWVSSGDGGLNYIRYVLHESKYSPCSNLCRLLHGWAIRRRSYNNPCATPRIAANRLPMSPLPRPLDGALRRVRGRQLYRFGACGRRCQPDAAYRQGSAEQRAMATAMRRGGMGVCAIARLMEVSPATVSRWTRL